MAIKVAYLAHPVSGDVKRNIARAKRWLSYLQKTYSGHVFIAPWITGIEICGDDDNDPLQRERGIQRDCAVIAKCDELWLCGADFSKGMEREVVVAVKYRLKIDHTFLYITEPPEIL